MPARDQRPRDGRADEPRRAGDQSRPERLQPRELLSGSSGDQRRRYTRPGYFRKRGIRYGAVGFPLFGFGHVRQLSVLLAFAGLGLGTAVIGWFGVDRVIAATLTIGWIGFMAFTACQLLLFVVCGLA